MPSEEGASCQWRELLRCVYMPCVVCCVFRRAAHPVGLRPRAAWRSAQADGALGRERRMLLVGVGRAEGEWPSVEVERGGRQTAAVYAPRLHRARSCVKYVRYVKLKNRSGISGYDPDIHRYIGLIKCPSHINFFNRTTHFLISVCGTSGFRNYTYRIRISEFDVCSVDRRS